MTYETLLRELEESKDKTPAYAEFQQKLLCTRYEILGVRAPRLRALAKKHKGDYAAVRGFPDVYYETVLLKFLIASLLPYEEMAGELDFLLEKADSWALTDSFRPACVKKHREDFLPHIERWLATRKEFFQRFALVMLLVYYVDNPYLPVLFRSALKADRSLYYVHMAAAWLIAEIVIKRYEEGKAFLSRRLLDQKTHNKAIQKALESFRLTKTQKDELKNMKMY